MTTANYTIKLNSDPNGPHPSKLLQTLIEGLSLKLDAEYPFDTFLGNWVWIIPLEQHEQYIKVRDVVQQRITKLYEAKLIRYGSW